MWSTLAVSAEVDVMTLLAAAMAVV